MEGESGAGALRSVSLPRAAVASAAAGPRGQQPSLLQQQQQQQAAANGAAAASALNTSASRGSVVSLPPRLAPSHVAPTVQDILAYSGRSDRGGVGVNSLPSAPVAGGEYDSRAGGLQPMSMHADSAAFGLAGYATGGAMGLGFGVEGAAAAAPGPTVLPTPGKDISDVLSSHEQRRLHVMVMGARNLPEGVFGGRETALSPRQAYVKLRSVANGNKDRQTNQSDVLDRGRGLGYCARWHQTTVFPATGPLLSEKLKVDVFAYRSMRSDLRVGGATLDLSTLEKWPAQPHAVWLSLHGEDSKANTSDSAEILCPVQPNTTVSGGVMKSAPKGGMPVGGKYIDSSGFFTVSTTMESHLLSFLDTTGGTRYALPELPPPPVNTAPCILLQLVFTTLPDQNPSFHIPSAAPQGAPGI
jgi:hypothetical protein